MTAGGGRSFILECESTEADLRAPRICRLLGRIDSIDRYGWWLATVDPPFIGQRYGLGAVDLSEIGIATKIAGQTLFDERVTIPVLVGRFVHGCGDLDRPMPERVEIILWCCAKPLL
jgi:hypothetical protein